jgi:aryl-alcohol dehydrogenase-like predicted oxidoreductase
MFRLKPADEFFAEAEARKVGILARVPLASGLLTGKFSRESTFDETDHRQFNRHGERFDKGETFSGVPYDRALEAVDALRPLVPNGATMSQFALRWILMWSAVTCAIPGAKTPAQALDNVKAADLAPISPMTMDKAREIYDRFVREDVHGSW